MLPLLCVLLSGAAVVVGAAPAAAMPPDAPAQPSAIAFNGSILLMFSPPADGGSPILFYTGVCTSSDGGVLGSATGLASPIMVGSLSNGKNYTCTVTATNADGDGAVSAPSTPVVPNTIPDAPAPPVLVPGDTSISVTFVLPFDGGSPITGYTADCLSSDGGVPGTAPGTGSPINVTGLTHGNTYTCTVVAANANGSGLPSGASAPVMLRAVPDAPAQPTVVAANASAVVSFSPPFDGGTPITTYTAACESSDGGAPSSSIGLQSPITVTGLSNGKLYTCTVLATSIAGNGPPSPPSSAVIPHTVPDAPAQPTAVAETGGIAVSFVPPFDGGLAITGYTVQCGSTDGGLPGAGNAVVSPVTILGLTNGSTYTCTVYATNADGDGEPSLPSADVVPNTFPDAPGQPTVASGNGRIVVTFAPPSTGGVAISEYTAGCTSSNGGISGSAVGPASPITVLPLTSGRTYTCKVFATNSNGAGPLSQASLPIVIATKPGRPPTPTVVAGNTRITVTVKPPASGGTPITAYRARCNSTNGGGGKTITSSRLPIAVTGLKNGYTYRCYINAINARGTSAASPLSAWIAPYSHGYRMFSGDGGIFTFGGSAYYGSPIGHARALVISMATTRGNKGYWLVSQAGEVFNFGDAKAYGSMGAVRLNQPIVGMAATPSGRGYWLVARDGGIFSFGDAHFYGSTGGIKLNQPIVGMTPTASGRGYWFVAADGGLFAFGDAKFYGSASGRSSYAVVGMATSASGRGYWIATLSGQVFAFGDATPFKAGPIAGLQVPIMGITATPSGRGYWLASANGGVFTFGDADFFRWPGPLQLSRIIRGISH